jgi:hypothetical protein
MQAETRNTRGTCSSLSSEKRAKEKQKENKNNARQAIMRQREKGYEALNAGKAASPSLLKRYRVGKELSTGIDALQEKRYAENIVQRNAGELIKVI